MRPLSATIASAVLGLALASGAALGQDMAVVTGRVTGPEGAGVASAAIRLSDTESGREVVATADGAGRFVVLGLAPGTYLLAVESPGLVAPPAERLAIPAGGRLTVSVVLVPASAGETAPRPVRLDASPLATRTDIGASQIERLPTALSLWSLVENQDQTATTSRIDVGGLWEASPALLSARAGTSWTQTAYALNGLDVTDPYQPGLPLLIPDVFGLASTELWNAALPVQSAGPGGLLTLRPRQGTPEFRGTVRGFASGRELSSSNVTPALVGEGITDSHRLGRLADFQLGLSGPLPLLGPAWRLFTSWTSLSATRDLAGYDREDPSRLTGGLVHVQRESAAGTLRLFWTGQSVAQASLGAGRGVPRAATLAESDFYNVAQVLWDGPAGRAIGFRAGAGIASARLEGRFQGGAAGPPEVEVPEGAVTAAARSASTDLRTRFSAFLDAQAAWRGPFGIRHLFEFGAKGQAGMADRTVTVPGNAELRFHYGRPFEAVLFNTPASFTARSAGVDLYVQDTITLTRRLALLLGANASWLRGSSAAGRIDGLDVSPRLGLDLSLSGGRRTSLLRFRLGRYVHALPLADLAWGHPSAPGGLAYAWTDANGDLALQPAELGRLVRREGPLFGAIDPRLERPRTDELAVSWLRDLGRSWSLSVTGFLRRTSRLVETVNVGVPASAYEPVQIFDAGDNRIPGDHDDLWFTVFDQKPESLGLDAYLLTNPGGAGRMTDSEGFDLVLARRSQGPFFFFLALTAMRGLGTTSPGNGPWENDDGIVGALDDDPNAAINARGRVRFDRAYTARLGLAVDGPWGLHLAGIAKYYDGQPFARRIIVEGLTQGPFAIQAHPRGVARYEFNMTVDLRLEKSFVLRRGRIRLLADAFNILNQSQATAENEWTSPVFPLRYATEIQSPRVLRLGLEYAF